MLDSVKHNCNTVFMRHRVFIAINLPEETKKELASYQAKWPDLPIRWTKQDNLHITLEFLGYLSDEELAAICQRTKEMALKHRPFTVTLDKICYGPPGKIPPRMIWAIAAPQSGASLALFGRGEKIQELNLALHITLGRIITWQWKQIEPEERPDVSEEINLNFEVNSIEVMESVLKKGGPEYAILESFLFK